MQKHVNLVDLVKSFPTNIFLQNLASIQKRTSPIKFAHLAEKSETGSMSNLSAKVKGAFSDIQALRQCIGGETAEEMCFEPDQNRVYYVYVRDRNESKSGLASPNFFLPDLAKFPKYFFC